MKSTKVTKPKAKARKVGSETPNKNKIGWIPDDERIRNGIAVLSELGEAGFDLAKFDDHRLGEFFYKLALFDKHVHYTCIKVARESSRRSRLKKKAGAQK